MRVSGREGVAAVAAGYLQVGDGVVTETMSSPAPVSTRRAREPADVVDEHGVVAVTGLDRDGPAYGVVLSSETWSAPGPPKKVSESP